MHWFLKGSKGLLYGLHWIRKKSLLYIEGGANFSGYWFSFFFFAMIHDWNGSDLGLIIKALYPFVPEFESLTASVRRSVAWRRNVAWSNMWVLCLRSYLRFRKENRVYIWKKENPRGRKRKINLNESCHYNNHGNEGVVVHWYLTATADRNYTIWSEENELGTCWETQKKKKTII